MNLADSASRHTNVRRHDGYAMAALLIAMSVMAILLTIALPTWRQTIQREKEEELIFRGTQYSRAISAYQRKYANASPPTLDVLVEQHYLRRKFKDPLAIGQDGEFQPLYVQTQGASSSGQAGSGTGAGAGSGAQAGTAGTLASTTPSGGIIGVASKNPAQSIREYNGHSHYNEWQFIPLQQTTRGGGAGQQGAPGPAGGGPAGAGQGGRGGPGGQGQSGQGQGGQGQSGRGQSGQGQGGQGGRNAPMTPQGR